MVREWARDAEDGGRRAARACPDRDDDSGGDDGDAVRADFGAAAAPAAASISPLTRELETTQSGYDRERRRDREGAIQRERICAVEGLLPMSSRKVFGHLVSLFVLVGCSGSAAPGIPAPAEIGSEPEDPADAPLNKRSRSGLDGGRSSADADVDSGSVTDAGAPDADAGGESTACAACSTTSCAAQRKACEEDATCPMLKQCLDACATSACRSDCFLEYPDPDAKVKNGALWKCE